MNQRKKLFLFCFSFCLYTAAYAQIEVANLMTKTVSPNGLGALVNQNFSALGFGSFLNLGFPVNETGAITTEGGVYYFAKDDNRVFLVPVLAGYRYILTGTTYGWYVEPKLGYTFGSTNFQKYNAVGNPLYQSNGNPLDQKTAGMTAGIGFGYLFQVIGRLRLNVGLRYEHTFVTGDPSPSVLSLRISHTFAFGENKYQSGY
ncbi:MAG: hypothetical protein JWQ66_4512 [Mucilaginibacter sp.]|nr:hypothetical protein [Mucilaginibacter sp.]